MKKELKIGIFAVVVLVVTFFVLNYLRGEDIFNREIELVSEYSQAEGLVASAPVYIKGYKAGKVMDVEYDTERDIFYVTCSVSKKFNIPSDSRMVIYSMDIMGGRGVKIEIGHQQSLAHDGDTLASAVEYGLMDELSSGISPLLAKVNGTDFESEKQKLLEIERQTFPPGKSVSVRERENWRKKEFRSMVMKYPFTYFTQHFDPMILLPDAPSMMENFGITTSDRGTMGVLKKEERIVTD